MMRHLLKQKHPKPVINYLKWREASFTSAIFEDIDVEMIEITTMKTKGGSGLSGVGADGWRRILVANS